MRFNLEIAVRRDFADLFEVKVGHIVRRGRTPTEWSDAEPQLRTTYRNRDFCREVMILPRRNAAQPVYANGRISFEVDLPPGGTWHTCLLNELGNGKVRFEAPPQCTASSEQSDVGQRLAPWRQSVLKVHASNGEAILGFQPDAPNDKLYIGPSLPDFDLRLWRDGEDPRKVLKGDANALIARSYASGSRLDTCDKTPSVS